jgi:hypothetical protein
VRREVGAQERGDALGEEQRRGRRHLHDARHGGGGALGAIGARWRGVLMMGRRLEKVR